MADAPDVIAPPAPFVAPAPPAPAYIAQAPDQPPPEQATAQTASLPGSEAKPATPAQPTTEYKDPTQELLDRMARLHLLVGTADPKLAGTMRDLVARGAEPDQRSQPGFRTDVAYALQDLEKFHSGRLELPEPLRTEMTQLAGNAIGLTNERMQALMRATASVQDRSLIDDIREAGMKIGRHADQSHSDIESRIEALENKARLTGRPAEPAPASSPSVGQTAGGATSFPVGHQPSQHRLNSTSADPDGSVTGQFSNAASKNNIRVRNVSQDQAGPQHSILDTLLRGMRPDGRQPQAPWEPPATPLADRMAILERRTQKDQDDQAFAKVEKRGKVALEALGSFTNSEGAAVMSRIEAAAKTEPGGMPQVLSEMRAGGRFQDLRTQFANALSGDAAFAQSYEKAAASLTAYGQSRTEAESIISRRPDAVNLTQRLEQLDAKIGEAAASTPAKTEGTSMMEDLSKKAAELLQRAVDAVKSVFSNSPSASATSSPSPSP